VPKLYSSNHVIKTLLSKGFVFMSQKGSHAKYQLEMGKVKKIVIIPVNKKEIPRGTLKSILRQSGLAEGDL
jgi:predicted RNA binding protein YcfA (HicA-like mRNA interferase family)